MQKFETDGPEQYKFIKILSKLSILPKNYTFEEAWKTGMMADSLVGAQVIIDDRRQRYMASERPKVSFQT